MQRQRRATVIEVGTLALAMTVATSTWAQQQKEEFKTIDKKEVERNSPGGVFLFKEKIDGQSKVVIHAPGGTIRFPTRWVSIIEEGSKIDGQSHVFLEAKDISFYSKIDGQSWVLVVVGKGGSLVGIPARPGMVPVGWFRVGGQSHVYWRKADPNDQPRISLPNVDDGSEVKEITDPKEWDTLVKILITDYKGPK
jgi:hypothetical protein